MKRPMRVIFDCSNGPTGLILKRVLKNYKFIDFKLINSKPDADFPAHGPDPSKPAALNQLSKAIKNFGADLGFIFDADGDRVLVIDERRKLVPSYAVAHLLFINHQGPFVANVLDFEALKYANLLSKNTFVSPVGTYFVKRLMIQKKANIGVEQSGHYFFIKQGGDTPKGRGIFCFDSGVVAAIKILNTLSQLPFSISQFKEMLPQKLSTQQIDFESSEPEKFVKEIRKRYGLKAKGISEIDGITLEFENGWFTVRPSNTEPLVRVFIGKQL